MTTFTTPPSSGQKLRGTVMSSLAAEWQIYHRDRSTLSASAASISFSVPAGLRQLTVDWSARSDTAASVTLLLMTVNSDSGSVYSYTYDQVNNTTAAGLSTHATTSAVCGIMTAASSTATWFGSGFVRFPSWDVVTTQGLGYEFSAQAMGTAVANQFKNSGGGIYVPAVLASRTTLTFTPQAGNFIAGTDFQLYGLIT